MTQNTIFHCKYFKHVLMLCITCRWNLYNWLYKMHNILCNSNMLKIKVSEKMLVKIPDPRRLESTTISPRDSMTINLRLWDVMWHQNALQTTRRFFVHAARQYMIIHHIKHYIQGFFSVVTDRRRDDEVISLCTMQGCKYA